jgi:hypothetical protein
MIDGRSVNVIQNVFLTTVGGEFGRTGKGFTVTGTAHTGAGGLGIVLDAEDVWMVRGNEVICSSCIDETVATGPGAPPPQTPASPAEATPRRRSCPGRQTSCVIASPGRNAARAFVLVCPIRLGNNPDAFTRLPRPHPRGSVSHEHRRRPRVGRKKGQRVHHGSVLLRHCDAQRDHRWRRRWRWWRRRRWSSWWRWWRRRDLSRTLWRWSSGRVAATSTSVKEEPAGGGQVRDGALCQAARPVQARGGPETTTDPAVRLLRLPPEPGNVGYRPDRHERKTLTQQPGIKLNMVLVIVMIQVLFFPGSVLSAQIDSLVQLNQQFPLCRSEYAAYWKLLDRNADSPLNSVDILIRILLSGTLNIKSVRLGIHFSFCCKKLILTPLMPDAYVVRSRAASYAYKGRRYYS